MHLGEIWMMVQDRNVNIFIMGLGYNFLLERWAFVQFFAHLFAFIIIIIIIIIVIIIIG